MKQRIVRQVFITVSVFLLVFFTLFFLFHWETGGDVAVVFFNTIFLVLYLIFLGIVTFSWTLKEKLGVIIGLIVSFILCGVLYATMLGI